jgi:glycosyltransferase involved in cell wall biosynthesis
MKVALVYDRVNKWGGAERVLLALHKLFPQAPLYTSVYDKRKAAWAKEFDVRASFLQKMPYAPLKHEAFALFMPSAFENFTFDEYDLVISVTSEAAKGVITKPGTIHICYCLTPTRYLWSGYDEYFESTLMRVMSAPAVSYLRSWDIVAAKRPDVLVAISHEVQKRIKKYYNRESEVIYPPLSFKQSELPDRVGSYFLVVSRLVRYKRIDIAIEACNRLELPLQIIGTGDEEKNLRKIAGPTIQFIGKVTDEELSEYYQNCRALLFPGLEDFGLTVVEAQVHGKPVIAYKDGGQLETVIDGRTGIFFAPQTAEAMADAIILFQKKVFNPKDAFIQAKKFSEGQFAEQITKLIKQVQNTV